MTPMQALPYVSHVLDTASSSDHVPAEIGVGSFLVGWQCGFEPLFVAVIASYTEAVDVQDAEDIARDYLDELDWFGPDGPVPADYVLRVAKLGH